METSRLGRRPTIAHPTTSHMVACAPRRACPTPTVLRFARVPDDRVARTRACFASLLNGRKSPASAMNLNTQDPHTTHVVFFAPEYRYSRYRLQSLTQQSIRYIPNTQMTIWRLARATSAGGARSSPRQGSSGNCCRFLIFRRRREPFRKWSEDSGGWVARRRTGKFPASAVGEAHAMEAFLPGFPVLGMDGLSRTGSCAGSHLRSWLLKLWLFLRG